MCATTYGNESFLVVIPKAKNEKVHVYNAANGQLLWSRELETGLRFFNESHSVTVGAKGRLFMDNPVNENIQMFSVVNGDKLGHVIKKSEYGLGVIKSLRWSDKSCSLIVAHGKNEKMIISGIDIRSD